MANPTGSLVKSTSPFPRSSLTRVILVSLTRAALLLGISAALTAVSLGAGVLALTAGSALILAWVYRRPWPVGWLTVLSPALAALLTLSAVTVVPVPRLGAFLLPGIAVGGVAGILKGLRHPVDRKSARRLAGPVWGYVLLWGLGLFAFQGGALSGEPDLARYGAGAAGLGAALQFALFTVILLRRTFGGRVGPMADGPRESQLGRSAGAGPEPGMARLALPLTGVSTLAFLALGASATLLAQGNQTDHDVELSRVLAGDVRGLSVRVTGGEGYASGRLIAHFTNDTGRTLRVGVLEGSLFYPQNSLDAPTMRSSSYHVLEASPGTGASQINAAPIEGYQPGGECAPRLARAPSGGNAFVGVACPFPSHIYGVDPGPGATPAPGPGPEPAVEPTTDPDYLPSVPENYVPRHLLVEGGEQAGVLMGVAGLLAGLLSSIGVALSQGATLVTGGAIPPEEVTEQVRELRPAPGTAPWEGPEMEAVTQALRQRHTEWLAAGGKLPETLAGGSPPSPWGGEGYTVWREQQKRVDRASQDLQRPSDLYDPTRMKQEEMEDYHNYQVMRHSARAVRFVRGVSAGAGDSASDPKPGFRTALSGALHAFWDAVGPDPTGIAEDMVDPQSEYRTLVEEWRKSQSFSRWLRIGTPRRPSEIPAMIQALLDERHTEQMAHLGDQDYFANEYPRWEEELRRLRAMEAWLGRAGGDR